MKDESEDAARSLFTFLDRDGNGTIDAQEMMDALMLLSDFESKHWPSPDCFHHVRTHVIFAPTFIS